MLMKTSTRSQQHFVPWHLQQSDLWRLPHGVNNILFRDAYNSLTKPTTKDDDCIHAMQHFTSLSWGIRWKMKLSEAVVVLIHPLVIVEIALVLRSGVTQTLCQCCHLIDANIEENRSYSEWSWWMWERKHRVHCVRHGQQYSESRTWANNTWNWMLLWWRW